MLLVFKKKSAHLLATISSVVLISCDPHIDSVYLGRSESKFLDDVSQGNTKEVKAYFSKNGYGFMKPEEEDEEDDDWDDDDW